MRYYLIVTGKGRSRRILTYFLIRKSAIQVLNKAILDYGWWDARIVTSSIEPPKTLHCKNIEPAE